MGLLEVRGGKGVSCGLRTDNSDDNDGDGEYYDYNDEGIMMRMISLIMMMVVMMMLVLVMTMMMVVMTMLGLVMMVPGLEQGRREPLVALEQPLPPAE